MESAPLASCTSSSTIFSLTGSASHHDVARPEFRGGRKPESVIANAPPGPETCRKADFAAVEIHQM
jgi:hypothetical protein